MLLIKIGSRLLGGALFGRITIEEGAFLQPSMNAGYKPPTDGTLDAPYQRQLTPSTWCKSTVDMPVTWATRDLNPGALVRC